MSPPILNAAAYRFVALSDLAGWRDRLLVEGAAHGLKGTVLIAAEGINLSLAGEPAPLREFLRRLTALPLLDGMAVRETVSATVPFERLRVKIKREIIRMNTASIRPGAVRAPAVAPATLAGWLDAGADDQGRALVLLDTRNAFEADVGRFRGALDWRLETFGDFPAALETHRAALAGKTVVGYCTGGIRCEKAVLLMAARGLANVWQLEGGILGYLQTVGGRHFDGHCVVFDGRGMLTDTLAPAAPL